MIIIIIVIIILNYIIDLGNVKSEDYLKPKHYINSEKTEQKLIKKSNPMERRHPVF